MDPLYKMTYLITKGRLSDDWYQKDSLKIIPSLLIITFIILIIGIELEVLLPGVPSPELTSE